MCILDLGMTLVYEFHCRYIKVKYGSRARLLFTDTDSLAYKIETKDFCKDIGDNMKDKFDTGNYPIDHPSCITTRLNKKVISRIMKDDDGSQTTKFVRLRSKLHSYLMDDDS